MNTEKLEQGSHEWHAARHGRVNASEVGAIMGVSPFTTRAKMLRTKVSGYRFDDNPAMAWGRENEETARKLYEFLYVEDDDIELVGYCTAEIDGVPLGASPDGFVGEGGVEIKCPYSKRHDERPVFKPLIEQPHYAMQIQLTLLVTGRPWWDFFQWAPNGYRYERVYPDPDFWDSVKDDLKEFYGEMIQKRETGDVVGNSARFAAAAEGYLIAKTVLDSAQKEVDEAKRVMVELCESEGVTETQGCGLMLSRVESKGGLDFKKWAADNEYVVPDEYRKPGRLSWRVTKTGEQS